jgi:hypothetical protein
VIFSGLLGTVTRGLLFFSSFLANLFVFDFNARGTYCFCFHFFFRDTAAQLRVSGVCRKSSPEYCVFVRVLCLDHVVHGQNMRTMDILHSRRRVVQSKGVKRVELKTRIRFPKTLLLELIRPRDTYGSWN